MSQSSSKSDPDPLHQQRSELRRLLSSTVDHTADRDVSYTQIETLLSSHPELIEDYASYVANEVLIDQSNGLSIFDGDEEHTPAVPRAREDVPVVHEPQRKAVGAQVNGQARSAFRSVWWAVAASLAIVLLGSTAWWSRPPHAAVIATVDARLSGGGQPRVGSDLGSDWIDLERGTIRLALREGVMASLAGPARFRAVADNQAELGSGSATFLVPPSGHGFVLTTEAARVVDLGTGFRTVVDPSAGLSVHVSRGVVRLEPKAASERLLKAGQSAWVRNDGTVDGKASIREPRVAGQFRYVTEHPESLGLRRYVHDDDAIVFLESHAIRLPYDLRLDADEIGQHDEFAGRGGLLPEGTLIDSYLIHCSPEQGRRLISGSVSFSGQIVGILCNSDRLNATNELLGNPWSLSCTHPERGVESVPDPNSDVLTISHDRRTFSADFRTISIDQVRVLVAR